MAERPLPAYQGDEPYIFVTYSHEDTDLVYPQIRWLQDQGFNVGWDEGISPGAVWRGELAQAIRGCSLLLYFTTPNSVASEQCVREVNFALDGHHRPVLAVHLVETALPDALALSLSDRQAVLQHALEPEDYERKLVSAVATYLDQPVPEITLPAPSRKSSPRASMVVVVAVCALLTGALGTWVTTRPEPLTIPRPVTDVTRYNYALADEERLVPTDGPSIAVSPDGSRIVYVGPAENGRQLWIRERDHLRSTPLPGSEGAWQPFFAPDGRGVGFITENRELKVISRIGDPPLTIVDDSGGLYALGGSWGADGQVYFSTATGLMRQSATGGGVPEPITVANPGGALIDYHAWSELLPSGKGALFTILKDHLVSEIAVVDVSTGQIRALAEGTFGRYAESGHLIYVREDGGLMAAPFDQNQLVLSGPGVLLGDKLPVGIIPDLALSKTGRLVYTTRPRRTLELVWVDRDGTWTSVDPDNPIRGIRYAALSPDNTKLAVNVWVRPPSDDGQLWIKQLPRGPFSQFTFEDGVNMRPSWSLDGRSVIFISDRGDNRDVWMKRADGTKKAEVLLDDPVTIDEAFYSPTGEWLVHRRGKDEFQRDILAIRPDVDTAATPLVASIFDEVAPALSPDGRWLAYVTDRGGQPNVYVRPFPEADTETQVSANGGTEPVWARNRPELYYRNGVAEMVAVPVLPGAEFVTGPEQVLFSAAAYRSDFFHATYDVSADGERFVMIRISDSGSLEETLIVVENWFEEVNRVAPTN